MRNMLQALLAGRYQGRGQRLCKIVVTSLQFWACLDDNVID